RTRGAAINRPSPVRCPRVSVALPFGHPKEWTPNTRFMESLDLQLWTRIGTINLHSAVRCPRFSVSLRFGHPKGWTPNGRFMESRDPPLSVNRDHEPRRVWSPGFSRLPCLRWTGPAKAGTPNKFMGSLHVQRCTRIGAMNHERKTSNIEHRTSNIEL